MTSLVGLVAAPDRLPRRCDAASMVFVFKQEGAQHPWHYAHQGSVQSESPSWAAAHRRSLRRDTRQPLIHHVAELTVPIRSCLGLATDGWPAAARYWGAGVKDDALGFQGSSLVLMHVMNVFMAMGCQSQLILSRSLPCKSGFDWLGTWLDRVWQGRAYQPAATTTLVYADDRSEEHLCLFSPPTLITTRN